MQLCFCCCWRHEFFPLLCRTLDLSGQIGTGRALASPCWLFWWCSPSSDSLLCCCQKASCSTNSPAYLNSRTNLFLLFCISWSFLLGSRKKSAERSCLYFSSYHVVQTWSNCSLLSLMLGWPQKGPWWGPITHRHCFCSSYVWIVVIFPLTLPGWGNSGYKNSDSCNCAAKKTR